MSNPNGRFGVHGGQYVPETLMNAIIELEEAYNYYKANPDFQNELTQLLNDYAGRPSRLYYAEKMTKDLGGAKIYLKREDLNHTGAHKINNVLGQALLAKKMGKTRLIAETGAGTGKTFDWSLVQSVQRPYFLAGGLDPDNVADAIAALHPYGVDVSSGIETDGVKDESKMAAFVAAARKEG